MNMLRIVRYRSVFLLLFLLCSISFSTLSAQDISVKSFRLLETDLTANTEGTMKKDQNNETAALIKVVTTETGFVFDGGMLGIVATQQTPGEIWVYVPQKSRKITIKHSRLGMLRDYIYPVAIEAGRTYEMVLSTGRVTTIVQESAGGQYLVMTVSPANAEVSIDDMPMEVFDGVVSAMLKYGTHTYRVSAAMHEPTMGQFEIGNTKKELSVALQPAYGVLRITTEPSGAEVYIDDNYQSEGVTPFTTRWLTPGKHTLQLKMPAYKTRMVDVTVPADGSTQVVEVPMQSSYGILSISSTPSGADVYIDGDYQSAGTTPFTTKWLSPGKHTLQFKMQSYRSRTVEVNVADDGSTLPVEMTLQPNFSEVTITVPGDAEIYVNNDLKGTGSWSGRLNTGFYTIEARKNAHYSTSQSLEIVAGENRTISLAAPTPRMGSLNVNTRPVGATLFLDGEPLSGTTPNIYSDILIGNHILTVVKSGYASAEQQVSVEEGKVLPVNMSLKKVSDAEGNPKMVDNSKYVVYERSFMVKGIPFKMMLVEGGAFMMGATGEQGEDAYDDEKPMHEVTLGRYYLAETEVTQALWKAVMGSNPSKIKGDDLPVERVSWDDCQLFIKKLNALTGEKFRLPTEAEWEYAARGGNKKKGYKYAGSDDVGAAGWYAGNSLDKTHAVKTKTPNELGLYDMCGNVWEWCSDWYGDYGEASQLNPKGPSSGKSRVIRGGSWLVFAKLLRVSLRHYNAPDYKFVDLGFRLALPAE